MMGSQVLPVVLQRQDHLRYDPPRLLIFDIHFVFVEETARFPTFLKHQSLSHVLQLHLRKINRPFQLTVLGVEVGHAREQQDEEVVLLISFKCVHEDRIRTLVLMVHLLENGEELTVTWTVLLEDETFGVEHPRVPHALVSCLVLKHQRVVLDSLSSLGGEVDDASHRLHYQSGQTLGCSLHEAQCSFPARVLERLREDSSNALLKTVEDGLAALGDSLDHVLRLLHALLLSMLLELTIESQRRKSSRNSPSDLSDGIQGSSNRVRHERSRSHHDAQAKFSRPIHESLSRLFLEVLDSSGDVAEETEWISNDVETADDLIELAETGGSVVRDKASSDAGDGVDAIVDLDAGHGDGGGVDVADHHAHSRHDGLQQQVVLQVQLLQVQLGRQVHHERSDPDAAHEHSPPLLRQRQALPSLLATLHQVTLLLVVRQLPQLRRDAGSEGDEVRREGSHQVAQVHAHLRDEGVPHELLAEHHGEVEDGLGVLVARVLLEAVRREDDRRGDDVRVGLVDLQEAQLGLELDAAVGLQLDQLQPPQGDHQRLVGRLHALAVLAHRHHDLRQLEGDRPLLQLARLRSTGHRLVHDDRALPVPHCHLHHHSHAALQTPAHHADQVPLAELQVLRRNHHSQLLTEVHVRHQQLHLGTVLPSPHLLSDETALLARAHRPAQRRDTHSQTL